MSASHGQSMDDSDLTADPVIVKSIRHLSFRIKAIEERMKNARFSIERCWQAAQLQQSWSKSLLIYSNFWKRYR